MQRRSVLAAKHLLGVMASWEAALLEDARKGEVADEMDDADEYRELSEDESDSQKMPSSQGDIVEISNSRWWWVAVLRKAVQVVTGKQINSSFPRRPVRVLSCCTGCSAESEVLKAQLVGFWFAVVWSDSILNVINFHFSHAPKHSDGVDSTVEFMMRILLNI